MDNLKVQELRTELHMRGKVTAGKRKPELERDFDELQRGTANVPALLRGVPEEPLAELGLNCYEISPIEPLHDLKGHLSNLIDEIKVLVTGIAQQKVRAICSSVLAKETLRGSDYRKAAILILLAMQECQPASALTAVLNTAVEICEILYSYPEKRTAKTVLRLHNLAFVHAKHCAKVFSSPKTMTRRKMFGRYFHSLTTHSPLVHRIISPCLLNTEVEECMFGQCKAITRSTSNRHTTNIISNILVRLQYEEQGKETVTNIIQKQENEVSKLAQSLPTKRNTFIPKEWIDIHYQAHLERIADYLIQGPGIWWQYINNGVEFFDVESPSTPPLTPLLHHFRSTSLGDVDMYLLTKWEMCLEKNIQLPATHIRTYTYDNVDEAYSTPKLMPTDTEHTAVQLDPSLTPSIFTGTEHLVFQLDPPLTPCTSTGTQHSVFQLDPPLTPCTSTGTQNSVFQLDPPLTPSTSTGTQHSVFQLDPPLTPCTSTGIQHSVFELDPPLTPSTSTGTQHSVFQLDPHLTPCTSTGTQHSVFELDPPLTPCTSTGTQHSVFELDPPLTPSTSTGTQHSVFQLDPPLTPCTSRGTQHSVFQLDPPLTPCTSTGTQHSVFQLDPPLTPSTSTGTQHSVFQLDPLLTPCTSTGTQHSVFQLDPPLTPCTSTGNKHRVTSSSKSKGNALHNKQLSSIAKNIISVVPSWMHKEVLTFNELRNKIKASNKCTGSLQKYRIVSSTVKDHLIKEYQESKQALAKNRPTSSQFRHKTNVLKKILYHEWKVEL